jgi:two-component system response regulator HupR/HoxA
VSPRILLVEDEATLRRALRRALEGFGTVAEAGTFPEAVACLDQGPVDVVLSDEKMPGGSGREILRLVRTRFPSALRLLMSADDIPSERDLDPAWEHFLSKPVDLLLLTSLVKAAT